MDDRKSDLKTMNKCGNADHGDTCCARPYYVGGDVWFCHHPKGHETSLNWRKCSPQLSFPNSAIPVSPLGTLAKMWDLQYKQQQLWHNWTTLTPADQSALIKDLLLGLNKEQVSLVELLDTDLYHILRGKSEPAQYDVAEAGVDVIKYVIALMLLKGVSPALFMEAFIRKTAVVEDKWKGEQLRLAEEVEICLFDIDGCEADWSNGFREWCASKGVHDVEVNHPRSEQLKDEFHRSGGFLSLAAIPGSVETIKAVKASGRKVVLLTARPHRQFQRVYPDTLAWCQKVGIEYDHIIFNRDKAEAVRSLFPAKVLFMVEDHPKHALELAAQGVRVYLLPSMDYNMKAEHQNIIRVKDWSEIRHQLAASGVIAKE